MTSAAATFVDDVWACIRGDDLPRATFEHTGGDGALAARLPVADMAAGAVAASLLAASALLAQRNAEPVGTVWLDTDHVAAAFRSERHARVDGRPVGASFAPLSRFWTARDGWIRTHANYAWHEARLLSVLGCGADVDAVARAIEGWRAADLEEAIFAANGCAGMVRDVDEWTSSRQGRAVGALPLLTLERVGNGEPRVLPPSDDAAGGVRVLDLTRVVAGPVGTRTLAAHGADVLRVDSPRLPELDQQWIDSNPGKRSTLLDFATDDGARTLRRLLTGADVVVVGYRPGSLARFGLSPDALASVHPGVVLVTLSAWGEGTSWATRRGFDSLVQSVSGIARVEADGDDPGVLPAQALDHATGYLIAAAAMAALSLQARDGGTWHARFSLAQTAAWLLRAPPRERALPPSSRSDPSPFMVDLHRGDDVVSLVSPPGMLGGRALAWPSAPPARGADEQEWRSSR